MIRQCTKCKTKKELNKKNFFFRKSNNYYFTVCRTCDNAASVERNKKWRKDNPLKMKAQSRVGSLKRKYNLTVDEVSKMLFDQKICCKICGNQFTTPFVIDHDHVTNKVRALLCNSCNCGVGFFKENIDYLKSAIAYLEEHKER